MFFLWPHVDRHQKGRISEMCNLHLTQLRRTMLSHRARRSRSTLGGRAIGEAGVSRPPGAMGDSLRLGRHYLHFSEMRPTKSAHAFAA